MKLLCVCDVVSNSNHSSQRVCGAAAYARGVGCPVPSTSRPGDCSLQRRCTGEVARRHEGVSGSAGELGPGIPGVSRVEGVEAGAVAVAVGKRSGDSAAEGSFSWRGGCWLGLCVRVAAGRRHCWQVLPCGHAYGSLRHQFKAMAPAHQGKCCRPRFLARCRRRCCEAYRRRWLAARGEPCVPRRFAGCGAAPPRPQRQLCAGLLLRRRSR
jgi:hypothetical protein